MSDYISTDPAAGDSSKDEYLSFDPGDGEKIPEENPVEVKSKPVLNKAVGDIGTAIEKGLVSVPQAALGIADIFSGGKAGKAVEDSGINLKKTQENLDQQYSPETQAANEAVRNADGFVDTVKAAAQNPRSILATTTESLPQMLGAGLIGRGIVKGVGAVAPTVAEKIAPLAAGAGEGTMSAGSMAEQVRSENPDKLLTDKQAAASIGAGAGTAVLGAAAARLAQKFGLGDINLMLAKGGPTAVTAGAAKRGFLKQIALSGLNEGAVEEMPQSMQEQMWQNFAQNKPLMDGVGNQAAIGLMSGGLMGGAGGGYNAAISRNAASDQDQPELNVNGEPQQATPEQQQQFAADLAEHKTGNAAQTEQPQAAQQPATASQISPAQTQLDAALQRITELEIESEHRELTPQENGEYAGLVAATHLPEQNENDTQGSVGNNQTSATTAETDTGSQREPANAGAEQARGQITTNSAGELNDQQTSTHSLDSANSEITQKIDQVDKKLTEIQREAHQAATSPLNNLPEPTQAMKEAGNYKKGHVSLHGLDITIENPQGSTRSGIDADGAPWSVTMGHHYGYIKRSVGADNEHVDAYIGDHPESTKAFVINQIHPHNGQFDEHKVMLGFNSEAEARSGYLKNYAPGWKGLDSITEMPVSDLKAKIESGAIKKPIINDSTSLLNTEESNQIESNNQRITKNNAAKQGRDPVIQSSYDRENASLTAQNEQILTKSKGRKPVFHSPPSETDELQQAIGKLGGIRKTGIADRSGFADYKGRRYQRLFNDGKNSKSFDEMAEILRGHGYNVDGENDLIAKLDESLRGQGHYTHAGYEAKAAQDATERYAAEDLQNQIADSEEAKAEREAKNFVVEETDDDELDRLIEDSLTGKLKGVSDDELDAIFGFTAQERNGESIEKPVTRGENQSDSGSGRGAGQDNSGSGDGASEQGIQTGGQVDAARQAADDFRSSQQRIINDLTARGKIRDLFDAAGVMTRARFDALDKADKVAAYVKMKTGNIIPGSKKPKGPLVETDLFVNSPEEEKALKIKQGLHNRALEKDAKRQGNGSEPPPLFSDNADMAGQQDLSNLVDTEEEVAKKKADQDFTDALADLGDVFGKNFRMNITPEQEQKLMPVLTRLMDAAFRKGYYKFKDAARFVMNAIRTNLGNDVAEQINLQHLQGAYIGMSGKYSDQGADGFSDVGSVKSIKEIEHVQRTNANTEPNSQDAHAKQKHEASVQPGQHPLSNRNGRTGKTTGSAGSRKPGSAGLSNSGASAAGKPDNQPVHTQEGRFKPESDSSGNNIDPGSSDNGFAGMDVNPVPDSTVESIVRRSATTSEKLEAQRAAERVKVIPGDRTNIDATLPFLMDSQREDVHFAEQRWLKPDGYGVLFTNGTGTGKTYLGIGAIKRMVKQGKTNGIIVVPNEAVVKAWTDSAPSLNLTITPLTDTKDPGRGIAITTYANFGQNDELASRKHDFVVIDEAHGLMMSKGADTTDALDTLRAISLHPQGAYTLAEKRNRDLVNKIQTLYQSIDATQKLANADDTMRQAMDSYNVQIGKMRNELADLKKKWDAEKSKVQAEVDAAQNEARPRVMFLSATPFAYEQNVQWGSGYLFHYPEVKERGYNTPSPYGQFMINHFGWRMRTGKLTEPDAKVDRDLMQRNFNTWLRSQGALSARMLDVDQDYERKFILIDGGIGQKIDEGLKWLREAENGRYWGIYNRINENFDYLTRQRLLEAIKAQASIDYIKQHHALGRKVVVFYDFNTGGGENVFNVKDWIESSKATESNPDYDVNQHGVEVPATGQSSENDYKEIKREIVPMSHLLQEFVAARPELQNLDFRKLGSPLSTLLEAFPGAGVYNGMPQYKKTRIQAIRDFNDDSRPDANLLLVQKAANAGWSGHDTTGKHMRVLINLGQPTAPIEAIQQEGRIYRVGQMSDANFQYFNTGTNWERYAFGSKISRRAGTAENLAMGEQARGLREAFIQAFENSDPDYKPSHGDGKGGKTGDRELVKALTEFDRAKAIYYGQQKKNSRTKSKEGIDYFATPEPIGQRMVAWGNIIPGDRLLEPSGGHGAIARWFPDKHERTVIEPSMELASRLTLATDAKLINDQFENHDTINKHDVIVMNPPFGSSGKTAIDHIDKAFKHLPDGGRIVAIIPEGPAANDKFDKWLYGEKSVKTKPVGESEKFGKIYKGDTAIYTPYAGAENISGTVTDIRGGLIYIQNSGASHATGKLENSIKSIQPTGSRIESKPTASNAFLIASVGLPVVTFERAGTKVKTRVVIIDKVIEPIRQKSIRPAVNFQLHADSIDDLFNAIENIDVTDRSLPNEKAVIMAQSTAKQEAIKATTTPYKESGKVQPEGAEPTIQTIEGDKLVTDAPRVEYVTKKGKKIYGVIAKGITKEQAQSVDAYTWAKDSGFFIRMEHVVRPKAENNIFYSIANNTVLEKFQQMVHGVLTGTVGHRNPLVLAKASPKPFILSGMNDLPIVTTGKVIDKAHFDHGLPESMLSQLPELLADPVMIFKSDTEHNGYVVVTDKFYRGQPVIAAIHADKAIGRTEVNFVSTSFPKDNPAIFEKWEKDGLLKFINDDKTPSWNTTAQIKNPGLAQVQFLRVVHSKKGSGNNVATQRDLINSNNELQKVSETDELSNKAIYRAVQREIDMKNGEPLKNGQQPAAAMRKIFKALETGKINQDDALKQIAAIHDEMVINSRAKRYQLRGERVRGADYIRQKLLEAKRRGDISEQEADFAEWFVRKNPDLLDDLGISTKSTSQNPDATGYYDPVSRIMTLIKGHNSDTTAVHEMLHHLERMMPTDLQRIIRTAWSRAIVKARAQHPELADYFDAALLGDTKAALEALKKSGASITDFYQFVNPSEFWAVNATNILNGRFNASGSFLKRIATWLKETYQHIKDFFGLDSKAPILAALDSIFNGGNNFQSTQMLVEHTNGTLFASINPVQKATEKLKSLISPEALDKIIYELQDKYIDLKRLRQHIQDIGGTINDVNDAYLGEELYHARLAKRTQNFLSDEIKPLIAGIRAAGFSIPEFERYLHARHAPEANAAMAARNPNQAEIDAGQEKADTEVLTLQNQLATAKHNNSATKDIEKSLDIAYQEQRRWNSAQPFKGTEEERRSLSGMSNDEAKDILNNVPPGKGQRLDELFKKVDAINEKTLDTLEKYGLSDPATLAAYRQAYKYYVPLHRDEAHPDSSSHPIGQGFSTKGEANRRRVGSNAKVTHILGHIAMQRETALTRGEKNLVMKKLYLMARQNPDPDYWRTEPVPTIKHVDNATGFVRTIPDPQYTQRPNVLMLRAGGKNLAVIFNEHNPDAYRLAQAMKNLDVDDLHYIIPFVGRFTRWLASVNTQFNPIFGIINFARDLQSGALNLSTTKLAGHQKEIVKDTMAIMNDVLKNGGRMPKSGQWADLFEEFQKVGGTTGYRDLYLKPEDRAKALLDELNKLDRSKIRQAAQAFADWLSDYNEAMENSVRLAAYKAALDNGVSKQYAASLAKNLTVNFNRKGRQTREIGALYAFFNASIQGTARMWETLSGPSGKKIMAGGVLVGLVSTVAGMAAMGAGGDDDNWDKIPQFIKERSLIIPVSDQDYIAIPYPLGFHFLPNIGRLAVESMVYGNITKQMGSMSAVLADAFNPMGSSSSAGQFISPTVIDPIVALMENKDWTGRPIYKEDDSDLDPTPGFKRTKDSAAIWSKLFAEAINKMTGGTDYTPGAWSPTPDQIDFVIGQVTGGTGREIGKAAQVAETLVSGDELPAHKIPLVGRIYGNTRGEAGQSERFYENLRKSNEAENEIKGRIADRIDPVTDLPDYQQKAEQAQMGNYVEKQMNSLKKMRHDMVKQGLPKDEIKKVDSRITDTMKEFNKRMANK